MISSFFDLAKYAKKTALILLMNNYLCLIEFKKVRFNVKDIIYFEIKLKKL